MNAAESLTPSHLSLVKPVPSKRDTILHCRRNHSLSANARLFFQDIAELSQDKGFCYARNSYLANLWDVPERTVERWLTELDRAGYIDRNGRGRSRKIRLSLRWTDIPVPEKKPSKKGGNIQKNPPLDGGKEFAIGRRKVRENPPLDGAENPPLDGAIHIDTPITDVVESARAREEPDNDDGVDLSFVPDKDRQHLPAIRETIRLLDGDRNLEVLKARTYGRGLGMAPAQHRALKAIVDELGWYPAVAACTIGAMIGVPLTKIRTVADQWAPKALTSDHDFWASRTV